MDSLTILYCCDCCKHVPMDDSFCFFVECRAQSKNAATLIGTWCGNRGEKYENDGNGCVVSCNNNQNVGENVVFMTGVGVASFALIDNVHVRRMCWIGLGRMIFANKTHGERSTGLSKSTRLLHRKRSVSECWGLLRCVWTFDRVVCEWFYWVDKIICWILLNGMSTSSRDNSKTCRLRGTSIENPLNSTKHALANDQTDKICTWLASWQMAKTQLHQM